MSQPVQTTTEQWLTWACEFVQNVAGVLYYDVEFKDAKLVFAKENQIESNPTEWLTYYQSVMTFYNSQYVLWKNVSEILENEYKTSVDNFVNDYADDGGAVSKGEVKARQLFSNIRKAKIIAEAKAKSWLANYLAAEGRRDVVSRSITARESDRKVEKW